MMTPNLENIKNGVLYLGLGLEEEMFLAPYYWFLPAICYLDYDHEQRLFLKNLKYETRELRFGRMKVLQAEWRPYNILRIFDIDAKRRDWIMVSRRQTSSLSISVTRIQMPVSAFLQSKLPVSLTNMSLVRKVQAYTSEECFI